MFTASNSIIQLADQFTEFVSSPALPFRAVKTLCLRVEQIWSDSDNIEGEDEGAEAAFRAEHRRIVEDVSEKVQSAISSLTVLRAAFISVSTHFTNKQYTWRPSFGRTDGRGTGLAAVQECVEDELPDPWSDRLQDVDRWLTIVDRYSSKN